MNFLDWIPAISTTSLLAGALWLCRSLISARLTRTVQHEFDEKIEVLRTNLRISEESFKAELRAKDTQIELLRSGAISGLASRQAALDKRRIEAVDQLWSSVTALAPAKAASALLATFKFKETAQVASKNPQIRQFFETFGNSIDLKNIGSNEAAKVRPFVSQMTWALYSAYQTIVLFAVVKLQMLRSGLDLSDALDTASVSNLVKIVLPHQLEYIQKYGDNAHHYLLDELELRLLEELQKMLQGAESDKATVEQAAAILKESERVMASLSQSTTARE